MLYNAEPRFRGRRRLHKLNAEMNLVWGEGAEGELRMSESRRRSGRGRNNERRPESLYKRATEIHYYTSCAFTTRRPRRRRFARLTIIKGRVVTRVRRNTPS